MEGFIFDLDGVIVFTDKFHYMAWKKLADKIGVYFDEEINNRLRGVSRLESLEIILAGSGASFTEAQKAAFASEKNGEYRRFLGSMTPRDVDGAVLAVLGKLRRLGYKLAIGSSSKNAGFILEKTGIAHLFDAVSDGNNITRSKPDPEVFLKAAGVIGVQPGRCAVIEDARAGIDAAKAAGMTAIGIGDAASYSKADYPLSRLEDILALISEGKII